MGTGSTLALLPAENATGNFVKVVQRLPVRIDLIDYDPDKAPLFVGLVGDAVRADQGEADRPGRGQGAAAVSDARHRTDRPLDQTAARTRP